MLSETDFISANEVRRLLGNISLKSLDRWRAKHWHEGIHYVQPGHRILYVKPMIIDWMINGKANPAAHQRAMEQWLTDHQHRKPRSRRNAG